MEITFSWVFGAIVPGIEFSGGGQLTIKFLVYAKSDLNCELSGVYGFLPAGCNEWLPVLSAF